MKPEPEADETQVTSIPGKDASTQVDQKTATKDTTRGRTGEADEADAVAIREAARMRTVAGEVMEAEAADSHPIETTRGGHPVGGRTAGMMMTVKTKTAIRGRIGNRHLERVVMAAMTMIRATTTTVEMETARGRGGARGKVKARTESSPSFCGVWWESNASRRTTLTGVKTQTVRTGFG